jgi:hypothetical protein
LSKFAGEALQSVWSNRTCIRRWRLPTTLTYVLEDGAIVAEGLASEMPGSAQVRESYLGL